MNEQLLARRRVRGLMVAGALLAAGALATEGYHRVWAAEPTNGASPVIDKAQLMQRTNSLAEIENGFAAIAERIEPSVVSIQVQKKVSMGGGPNLDQLFRDIHPQVPGGEGESGEANPQRPKGFRFPFGGDDLSPRQFNARGAGSGVIVQSDGWILTNDHVVEGADRVNVSLHDGRTLTGTVRRDPRSDLAVVKIDATGLVPAEFADSDKLRVGQWAIAFGSPFELNDTMTVGVISARQRQKVISDGSATRFYPNLIQTDASINPGNSGGALVDSRGRVIGINVAINSPNGGNVGIAFAIPANTARHVMDQLVKNGKVTRGFLGVRPGALTPNTRTQYKVSNGALVEEVSEDTPAARAGLQVEDVVIKVNGKAVRDDIEFRDIIARTAPGQKIDLVIVRAGSERTITATVGEPPAETASAQPKETRAPAEVKSDSRLGVTVEPNEGGVGVVVRQVEPGGPAAEEGIRPGDVILRANGRDVRSMEDLKSAVSSLKAGEPARLVLQRGKTKTLAAVTVR